MFTTDFCHIYLFNTYVTQKVVSFTGKKLGLRFPGMLKCAFPPENVTAQFCIEVQCG